MATGYQNNYLIAALSYSYKCQALLFVRNISFIQKFIFRHKKLFGVPDVFCLTLCTLINILVLTPFNDALIKYIGHNTFIK